jgi:hypothetical protein
MQFATAAVTLAQQNAEQAQPTASEGTTIVRAQE